MKKIVLLAILAMLTVACHNNSESELMGSKRTYPKLSQCLEEAFVYYVKEFDEPDTSAIYLINFLLKEPGAPKVDTLILIYELNKKTRADGIKGITTIGDYKVLIIDEYNVGKSLYNMDSLMDTDLDRFSPSKDIVDACSFILIGGSRLELI